MDLQPLKAVFRNRPGVRTLAEGPLHSVHPLARMTLGVGDFPLPPDAQKVILAFLLTMIVARLGLVGNDRFDRENVAARRITKFVRRYAGYNSMLNGIGGPFEDVAFQNWLKINNIFN